jgi:apolipoprotein N-acyltransferase
LPILIYGILFTCAHPELLIFAVPTISSEPCCFVIQVGAEENGENPKSMMGYLFVFPFAIQLPLSIWLARCQDSKRNLPVGVVYVKLGCDF